ncbi:MAG: 50S ribosomal protein L25/general stress protein Ctc [Alphaproteobacteria bacterium]|nr:50S ribosomal protein L25/general stress protein Ctc [Alphaproteobacteria bacterium]MCL2889817.1 50S ribosomal protein L25/general stress protein Ctc [Alphaproteobacteria bacterium]
MSIKLNAGIRNVAGKGAARAVRNNKKVPAVIYGDKKDPVAIEFDAKSWVELIRKPGLRTKLFEIDTGAGTESAMLIDIQYHPVSDAPVHVDFKRIDVKKPVSVSVPIELINVETAPAMKMGGTLNFATRKVAIVAKVNDIPESIAVDLTELSIGDVVHGAALKLPTGVELGLRQAEQAFVAIAGKLAAEEEPTKAAAAPAKGKAAPAKAAAPAKPAAPAKKK